MEKKNYKYLWSTLDYEKMDWHDCTIHAMTFINMDYKFALDINYIFEWGKPQNNEKYYSLWMAAATLLFADVYNLHFDIQTSGWLTIDHLIRDDYRKNKNTKKDEWKWTIECQEGIISFFSSGFSLIIKNEPIESKEKITNRNNTEFNFYTDVYKPTS
jgi:hypothetical protein